MNQVPYPKNKKMYLSKMDNEPKPEKKCLPKTNIELFIFPLERKYASLHIKRVQVPENTKNVNIKMNVEHAHLRFLSKAHLQNLSHDSSFDEKQSEWL